MQITNKSIREVLERVQSHEIVLPALQREYVWKRRDIEGLFDSLLRGYPINTFMSWEVQDISMQTLEFYNFLEPTYKEGNTNTDYRNNTAARKSVIIDGQQRLTSLYIALYGSYTTANRDKEMFLCLNMDKPQNAGSLQEEDDESDVMAEEDQNLKYNLRFMTDNEMDARTKKGEHWLKLPDAFHPQFKGYKWLTDNGLTAEDLAVETMEKLVQLFKDSSLLNFYEIQSDNLQNVLDIFVRTNNGGKKLTKGDLLLSMITVGWSKRKCNARDFVEDICSEVYNKYHLRATKDWILKCILFILDKDVRLNVENFSSDTSLQIYDAKDDIRRSIIATFEFINYLGITERGLSSKLALLPITYYIYHYDVDGKLCKPHNGHYPSVEEGVLLQMRTWLFRALVCNFFTHGSDEKLMELRLLISGSMKKDYFPIDILLNKYAVQNVSPSLYIDESILLDMLHTRKKDAFPLLNIVYSADYKQSVSGNRYINSLRNYDVDHVHPKTLFTGSTDKTFDTLLNLQLLTSEENKSKNDTPYKEWVEDMAKQQSEMQRRLLPIDCSLEYEDFELFIKTRKSLILPILTEKFDFPDCAYYGKSQPKKVMVELYNRYKDQHDISLNLHSGMSLTINGTIQFTPGIDCLVVENITEELQAKLLDSGVLSKVTESRKGRVVDSSICLQLLNFQLQDFETFF